MGLEVQENARSASRGVLRGRVLCRGSRARASCSQAVDFRNCDEIPESAWAALEEGVWPVLRNAEGVPETHLSRLRGRQEG